jgi:hypothetical protein
LLHEISSGEMGQITDFCEKRPLKKTSAAYNAKVTRTFQFVTEHTTIL